MTTALSIVETKLETVPEGQTLTIRETIGEFMLAAQNFSQGSEELVAKAKEFIVDSAESLKSADEIQDLHKRDAKRWNDTRLGVTRWIDDLKADITAPVTPGIQNNLEAAKILQDKMTAYRTKIRQEAEASRREAERVAEQTRLRLEAEARKREEKAAKLKTAAGIAAAMAEAEALRQAAAMQPTNIALAAEEPELSASGVSRPWTGTVTDVQKALHWIADNPDWHCMVKFGQRDLNDLARRKKDTQVIPGFEFTQKDSFRSKGQ